MSQPTIESVIEEVVKTLMNLVYISRSEERTRCIEIVERHKRYYENGNDAECDSAVGTCDDIIKAINTNNK